MTKSSGSFFSSLLSIFTSLFGKKPANTTPAQPAPVPDSANEPSPLTTSKVLVLVYDPTMEDGQKLSKKMGWKTAEQITTEYMGDILQTSVGTARYQIAQRIDIDEFPAKVGGARYTPETYMKVLRGEMSPLTPSEADMNAILTRFNILPKIARSEIDEVWIFAFPQAGFYESTMGGVGAFWCNAPAIKGAAETCPRRFVVMGFNYERGVGEMLESFGHRAESIMEKTFEKLVGSTNLWQRFIRYEKSAPGHAACGNVHFAPNSERDYDWNNPNPVQSECDDWLKNFPDFKGGDFVRTVGADEWGSGDIREHHKWWLKHFPHVSGRKNGIHNNWWQYILDANKVKV